MYPWTEKNNNPYLAYLKYSENRGSRVGVSVVVLDICGTVGLWWEPIPFYRQIHQVVPRGHVIILFY